MAFNLAGVLAYLDRYDEAIGQYRNVIKANPESAKARLGLVAALVLSGKLADALTSLEQALSDFPQHTALQHVMARLLAAAPNLAIRNGQRALALAQTCFKREPNFSHGETLAMAHAQVGEMEQAISLQRELIEKAKSANAAELLALLQVNLARYETGNTCCAQEGTAYLLP